jgi:CheY-like chemotaxis protein
MLPEEERWFVGDSGKIRQIVCNLVSNAFKYGRPREAGIEVRIAPEGLNRSRLRIAVRNTGPTIPPDELPRLFESFRRGTTAGNAPGSGLGLAVCRRLAEAMGGRMTAASANETTEFALELLLDQSHRPESRRANAEVVSRVLAIEDEEYNRLALGHVLRSLGYTIDWAPDGAAALQLAGRNPYDLVVTDWRLPDTDGGTLCRQLLDILPEPKPPIIAVTAYSTGEKLEEAKTAGMAAFITKPVTREKLERLIRDLSAGINPRRSLDVNRRAAANPLAELGDLAPSVEKLAADIAASWQQVEALAQLRDPRTARLAHALRSLLLLAGESDAAEQLGLLESAASEQDWDTAHRLLPVLAEDIGNVRSRLKLG